MAKLTEERVREAFKPHLQEGEALTHFALGVKQPHILLIILLIALAVLPGIIAVFLLTKNYCIGLTNRRFIVLQIASPGNLTVKAVTEYSLDEIKGMKISTSTGGLFTHFRIQDEAKPFQAKFHRALAKFNRPNAMAIAEAITPKAA
jgi:hypothetical protein